MKTTAKPLISVITSVRNAEDTIESTIQSVISQSFTNFEYIIRDGASTDKTYEKVLKYKDKLTYCQSEPDAGIYDGLNKAIALAHGEWVILIHSGDSFVSPTVLAEAAPYLTKGSDAVYGNALCHYSWGATEPRNGKPITTMWQTMPFSHQAIFVRTEIQKQFPFDTSFKICADYDCMYKLYTKGYRFTQIPLLIANFAMGGTSDKRRLLGQQEVLRIKKTYDTNQYHILLHRLHMARTIVNLQIKKLLPTNLVQSIISQRAKTRSQ